MTAPSPTAAQAPSGRYLGDGYQTLVTFAYNPTVALWVITVTPPGVEGDNPNETMTMHNTNWRTKAPRHLKTLSDFSMTARYDPAVYVELVLLVNRRTTITVHFPDGSSLAFYGFLKSFKPGALEEGKPPDCTLDVVPTNQDPITCAEEGPTYTAGSGTSPSC